MSDVNNRLGRDASPVAEAMPVCHGDVEGANPMSPVCTLIVVNYNGLRHLPECLGALERLAYPKELLDLIMVDNGSSDGSIEYVDRFFPSVRVLVNDENNYARALNRGIAAAKGEYIGFVNNDLTVDAGWLQALVDLLEGNQAAGGAAGKILFKNGRINSVGHRALPDFYFEDVGFDEEDRGQYDAPRDIEVGLCGAAALYRKTCLEDVGLIDEDFVMYCEDVEYGARARRRGWKFLYSPTAIAHHEYRGSSRGTSLTEYYCNRNRFLYLAKHVPDALAPAVLTSHFYKRNQHDLLLECMPVTVKKLLEHQPAATVGRVLPALCETLVSLFGVTAVDQLLARLELVQGYRRMSMGIYDHALHVIGGGQKYMGTIAAALQDRFDITFISNKPVRISDLEEWYRLDLSRCQIKIIPLPFYETRGRFWIDSGMVTADDPNPFEAIAAESAHYDIFVNANMLEKVMPLSPLSIFICHFPDSAREHYFAVDKYTLLVVNSEYGAEWVRKRWGLEPTLILYPPVDAAAPRLEKERLILSVARFEPGGSKRQDALIGAFRRLLSAHPRALDGWRLVLAGGSMPDNEYLRTIQDLVARGPGSIELRVNTSYDELLDLYARASIFWHACGLNAPNPNWVEHFGMTTVEAMQNSCVPIVINGGGQREIVEHGRSGLLFDTVPELCAYTRQLIEDGDLRSRLQEGAAERSRRFTRARFEANVERLFGVIVRKYSSNVRPEPQLVLARLSGQPE
jgi:GT2 family glycosyltransferase/glycosyltransferase involved in cell wall biosynthesis